MKNLIREQYLNNKEKGDDILLEDAYSSMYNKQPTQSITTDDVASVLDNIEEELMQMRLYINLDGRNTLQLVPLVQNGDIEAILDTLSPRISDQDGGEPHNFKMIEDMIRDAFIDIMPDGPMSESKDKKPDEDGDGVPDWADKKPGEDDNKKKKSLPPWLKKEEDEEEKLDEQRNKYIRKEIQGHKYIYDDLRDRYGDPMDGVDDMIEELNELIQDLRDARLNCYRG